MISLNGLERRQSFGILSQAVNAPNSIRAQREFFNTHEAFYERIFDDQLDDENVLMRAQDYLSVLNSYGFPEAGTPAAELMREAALNLPFDVARAMARAFTGETIHPRAATSVYDIIGPVFAHMSRLLLRYRRHILPVALRSKSKKR